MNNTTTIIATADIRNAIQTIKANGTVIKADLHSDGYHVTYTVHNVEARLNGIRAAYSRS